jgi:hypothetical protein
VLTAIDNWRRKQADLPSRPEAIRQLVELGLEKDGTSMRSQVPAASARAAELAADAIDARMAADATTEERHTRKERLLKGPSPFREVRKDHS